MKLLHCRFFSNYSFNKETSSGVILVISAAFAMLLANLSISQDLYIEILNIPIELHIGTFHISKNMLLFVNDSVMIVFFLLVGLEVKRELIQGSLANCQQAMLPIIAAIGGIVTPILIYLFFNYQDPITCVGWAIPSATDIAFTLGVMALLGNRIPTTLKIFLMALAIIDDLSAIIIIAFFYSNNDLSFSFLSIAAAITVMLALLNIYNVHCIGIYILLGIVLWIAILKSGIHETLSGIIISSFIPLKEKDGKSQAKNLEYILRPWVAFLILPLFAFVNSGVPLQDMTLDKITSSLPIGIIIGLFIGKPLGISLFCWLAIKLKLALLPVGTTFRQIMIVGILCGIGFTMSIFIANLAFNIHPQFIILSKISILTGSLLSALVGYTLLKLELSKKRFG